jgi:hypothetical protein
LDATKPLIIAEKYRVVTSLGSGSFASVYKCRQIHTEQEVAVKVLTSVDDLNGMKRFRQEARLLSNISHPNVVKVLAFGLTEERKPYLTMELIRGRSLEERIKEGPELATDEFVSMFCQILDGLGCLHAAGIVHRDLKPSNIVLVEDGGITVAKIVDLGIAKEILPPDQQGLTTKDGQLLGTPQYMSPEQCKGKSVDARSDLYSLGCIVFQAVMRRPLGEGTPMELLVKRAQGELPDLPTRLQPFLQGLLEAEPSNRIQSAESAKLALLSLKLRPHEHLGQLPPKAVEAPQRRKTASVARCYAMVVLVVIIGGITAAYVVPRPDRKFTEEKKIAELVSKIKIDPPQQPMALNKRADVLYIAIQSREKDPAKLDRLLNTLSTYGDSNAQASTGDLMLNRVSELMSSKNPESALNWCEYARRINSQIDLDANKVIVLRANQLKFDIRRLQRKPITADEVSQLHDNVQFAQQVNDHSYECIALIALANYEPTLSFEQRDQLYEQLDKYIDSHQFNNKDLNIDAPLLRAEFLFKNGRVERSAQALTPALSRLLSRMRDPKNLPSYLLVASTLNRIVDLPPEQISKLAGLDEFLKAAADVKLPKDVEVLYLTTVSRLASFHDLPLAIRIAKGLLAKNQFAEPNAHANVLNLLSGYVTEPEEKLQYINEAEALVSQSKPYPKMTIAWRKATVLAAMGRYAQAKVMLEKALDLAVLLKDDYRRTSDQAQLYQELSIVAAKLNEVELEKSAKQQWFYFKNRTASQLKQPAG